MRQQQESRKSKGGPLDLKDYLPFGSEDGPRHDFGPYSVYVNTT